MIPHHLFGRTEHLSTRTIFGAAALGGVTQEQADQTLEVLLSYGVNHIDTAASYGESEVRLRPWLRQHRRDFFLATKTGERTYVKARQEIHRSLERMGVESVDLLQLHCLIEPSEWDVAMGPGGALEAALEARDQGLTRFIGVTGHGLSVARMHLKSLERFDFDSVLLPWNFLLSQNEDYAREFAELEALCRARNVPVQTIKSITRRPWGQDAQNRATWYQPLEDPAAIDAAVWWLLDHDGLFLNTVGDIDVLPRVLDAAARWEPGRGADAMPALVAAHAMEPLFV